MMSKPLNKSSWLLTGAATIAALVLLVLWAVLSRQPVVEVQVIGSKRVNEFDPSVDKDRFDGMVCYFIEPNFQLRWIHSVEKQWWEEQYQREGNELLLTTTYFEAFGAGTPATEALAPVQKPGYIGYQINQKLPQLNWVVSRLTKGEIDYGDYRLLIHQWLPDYSEVTIAPKMYSVMDRFKKDFCHELKTDGSK